MRTAVEALGYDCLQRPTWVNHTWEDDDDSGNRMPPAVLVGGIIFSTSTRSRRGSNLFAMRDRFTGQKEFLHNQGQHNGEDRWLEEACFDGRSPVNDACQKSRGFSMVEKHQRTIVPPSMILKRLLKIHNMIHHETTMVKVGTYKLNIIFLPWNCRNEI